MHKDGTQTETIMTADDIPGPYEMVREGILQHTFPTVVTTGQKKI